MALEIKNNLIWVGKKDGDLQHFHGLDYPTNEGASHNSYLIREEKTVLVDTVWSPYANEFVEALEMTVGLKNIDYMVVNHAEVDCSGALPLLLEKVPELPIYCTAPGAEALTGIYHQDWNFQIVKTGDSLELGNGKSLLFMETPMLHWPDSMMSYLSGDGVLFSNDIFGQHYSSKQIFNDLVDPDALYHESIKYYANILTPYNPVVINKLRELIDSGLAINMICPANGVIWRNDPAQIIQLYQQWAAGYRENQITLVYDSQRNSTAEMAAAIRQGIEDADSEVVVRTFNLAEAIDFEALLTEIFRSKGLVIGSPTIHRGMLPEVAALLEAIEGLRLPNKYAAAFGSYGWSGEAVDKINERLAAAGFSITPGLQIPWKPDSNALAQCGKLGRDLAQQWQFAGVTTAATNRNAGTVDVDPSTPYRCWACGWVYDPAKGLPEQGIPPGTPWEDVPDDMQCPICFLDKSGFDPIAADEAERSIKDTKNLWD